MGKNKGKGKGAELDGQELDGQELDGQETAAEATSTKRAAKAKEPRPPRNPVTIKTAEGEETHELASLAVFIGANVDGVSQPVATSALVELGASFEGVGGKAGPAKFVADRLWYGRFKRMKPAKLSATGEVAVLEAVRNAKAAADAASAEKAAAKAAKPTAKRGKAQAEPVEGEAVTQ